MALTISATDVELQKPVNVIYKQTFLRNAQPRCPYFTGTLPGEIIRHGGSATMKWRRIENLTPTTSALSEQTGTAAFMGGRDSTALSFTDVLATIAKYGQFVILNEEVDIFNFNTQADKIFQVLGISAGESLNRLMRNVGEDNATIVYTAGTSDGAVNAAVGATKLGNVIQTLDTNHATTFTPFVNSATNVNTAQVLPSYWLLCHTHVARDIANISGFTPVEKYAGQTQTMMGEFGAYTLAGSSVRCIASPTATIDADSGAAVGSTGLRSTTGTVIDLYTTLVFGQEALGSIGLGEQHADGIYKAGDSMQAIDLITKPFGSGGTSDPYNEIMTIAWKSWFAGAILNTNWIRAIRSGATNL